eukprot:m.167552 g.167552  ORF g.167552 m.167552 type:complete len:1077 (+) comp38933_c0_seq1:17-3247(+)
MARVNAKGNLKPIVTYHGDPALFSSFHAQLAQKLPTEAVKWERSFGRNPVTLFIDPNFVPFSDELVAVNPVDKGINLHEFPFLHLYWTECNEMHQYKGTVKEQISRWLDVLKDNQSSDWLIVVVSQQDSSPFTKPKANIMDKIKSDFCSKATQRCIQLKYSSQHQETKLAESWQALLSRIRQLILQSFSRNLPRLEEVVRKVREKRMTKSWNFCDYFILQEQLAFVFEMLSMYEDALIQYDELDAMFSQYVINTHAGEYPSWLSIFAIGCQSWHGVSLHVSSQGVKAQRNLIRQRTSSLLQFRNYLFLRQATLLFAMNEGFGVAERAFNFMHGCLQELQLLQVPLIDGAADAWVHLSCMQILFELEKLSSVELGLVKEIAHERMFVLRADLLKYAWEKLKSIGTLCHAFEVKRSSLSECAIEVMHGIMGGDEQGISSSEASLSLQAALCSSSDFDKLYLELGQKTLKAYQIIQRKRFAAHIGFQLALFNLARGNYDMAEPLLTEACQIQDAEHWYLLSANVLVPLADCLLKMGHIEKYASTCSSLACYDPSLPDSTHDHYYNELLEVSKRQDGTAIYLPFEVMFRLGGVKPTSDDSVFCTDEDAAVVIELHSSAIKPVYYDRISLSLHCKHSALESPAKSMTDKRTLTEGSLMAKLMEDGEPRRRRRTSSRSEGDKQDMLPVRSTALLGGSCGSIDLLGDDCSEERSQSERSFHSGEGETAEAVARNEAGIELSERMTLSKREDDKDGLVVDDEKRAEEVKEDVWEDEDDERKIDLIWLESEGSGELNPGLNTIVLQGKVAEEGQYYIRGLEIETGTLQYILPRIPMPRRKQGLVILPRKTDVEVNLRPSHGECLVTGVVESIRLSVKSGRNGILGSSMLDLLFPPYVSVNKVGGAFIETETENLQANLIGVVAEEGAPVKICLPSVDPFCILHIDMWVLARDTGMCNPFEAEVAVSCLWVNPLLHCRVCLKFCSPFTSSYQLHTAGNSFFLQLLFKNVFPHDLVITSVDVQSKGFDGLKPLHAPDEKLVIPTQTMSFMWKSNTQPSFNQCCCTVKYKSQDSPDIYYFQYHFSSVT